MVQYRRGEILYEIVHCIGINYAGHELVLTTFKCFENWCYIILYINILKCSVDDDNDDKGLKGETKPDRSQCLN